MTLNKEKCTFQVKSVKYLGNVITASGVKPDPEKVRAITDIPPPADRKGVERLLGTVNYLAKICTKYLCSNRANKKSTGKRCRVHVVQPTRESLQQDQRCSESATSDQNLD